MRGVRGEGMADDELTFELVVPASFVDEIAQRAAEIVLAELATVEQDSDAWMTVSSASEYVGVTKTVIYDAVASGRLEAGRAGRSIRIKRSEVDAWLERRS